MMNTHLYWQHQLPNESAYSPAFIRLIQQQSLTAALRSLGHAFSVKLLHLGERSDDIWLQPFPNQQENKTLFCRDVLLCLDDIPVVKARSACFAQSHYWKPLLDCGERPLGELLFDGSLPLTRTPFEFACMDEPEFTPTLRRSWFEWNGETLGLAECFLPELADFLK